MGGDGVEPWDKKQNADVRIFVQTRLIDQKVQIYIKYGRNLLT